MILDPPPPAIRRLAMSDYRAKLRPSADYPYGAPLGAGHYIEFFLDPIGGEGAVVRHMRHTLSRRPGKDDRSLCEGALWLPGAWFAREGHTWHVTSEEPLEIAEPIDCHCGDRGKVRGGKWIAL